MVKFVNVAGEHINPEYVETVGIYGPGDKVGIKMRSGEVLRVGDMDLEETVALLEGRDRKTTA